MIYYFRLQWLVCLLLLVGCGAAADTPSITWRDFRQLTTSTLRTMYVSVDGYVTVPEADRLLKGSMAGKEGIGELNEFCQHFKFRFDLSPTVKYFLGAKATGHNARDVDNLAQILGECYLRYRVHNTKEFSFWGKTIGLDDEISKIVDTNSLNTHLDLLPERQSER